MRSYKINVSLDFFDYLAKLFRGVSIDEITFYDIKA